MKNINGMIQLSASDLVGHLNCSHLSALDLEVARGSLGKPDYYDPLLEVLRERGFRHEQDFIAHLQESGRLRLQRDVPRFAGHPVWGGPGWKVFQDHPDDIRRTVRYINDNPGKYRLDSQHCGFIRETVSTKPTVCESIRTRAGFMCGDPTPNPSSESSLKLRPLRTPGASVSVH